MKRYNNLYDKMLDFEVINKTYKVIRKNTKNKDKLFRFEQFYSLNIINIYNSLKNKTYNPGLYNVFIISEPKYRIIMS